MSKGSQEIEDVMEEVISERGKSLRIPHKSNDLRGILNDFPLF